MVLGLFYYQTLVKVGNAMMVPLRVLLSVCLELDTIKTMRVALRQL